MNARLVRCGTAAVVMFCCWGIATNALGGGRRSPRNPEKNSDTQSSDSIVCAIVGDVQNPGSYRFAKTPPTMYEIVEIAGGVSAGSTGTSLRVFGKERLSYHEYHDRHDWEHDQQLAPGDVVIISSKRPRLASRRYKVRPVPSARPQKKSHIVLVGVQKAPVVLPLPDSGITLMHLLDRLRQPRDLAESVRIVYDEDQRPGRALSNRFRILKDGMLIVFDSQAVKRADLPKLREPIFVSEREKLNARLDGREQTLSERKHSSQWKTDTEKNAKFSGKNKASALSEPIPFEGTAHHHPMPSNNEIGSRDIDENPLPAVDRPDKAEGSSSRLMMMAGSVLTFFGAGWLFLQHRRRLRKKHSRLSDRIETFVKHCHHSAETLRADEARNALAGPRFAPETPAPLLGCEQNADTIPQHGVASGSAAREVPITATPATDDLPECSLSKKNGPPAPNSSGLMHRVLRQLEDSSR